MLKITNLDNDFVVFIGTCLEGLGGVLISEDHVVDYESQKINDHEGNYVIHDLEIDAIIEVLKMYRHYLIAAKKFTLIIDHVSLK